MQQREGIIYFHTHCPPYSAPGSVERDICLLVAVCYQQPISKFPGEMMTTQTQDIAKPHITLITVCWNAAETIGDTLKSIDAQTYRDFEHLVIDGASADGTQAIVEAMATVNRRLLSEPDKGIYDAMNKGIRLARGEIIGLLNADDVFADSRVLERVANAFSDPDVDCCFGDLVYVDRARPDHVTRYWRSSDFEPGSFRRGWFPPHPTLYLRRSVYDRVGDFDLGYRHAADVEFMRRVFEGARCRSLRIPEVLVRMKSGGASNNGLRTVIRQNREILQALSKHGLAASPVSYWISKLANRFVQIVTGKLRAMATR